MKRLLQQVNRINYRLLSTRSKWRVSTTTKYTLAFTTIASSGSFGYLVYIYGKGQDEINKLVYTLPFTSYGFKLIDDICLKYNNLWTKSNELTTGMINKLKEDYLPKRKLSSENKVEDENPEIETTLKEDPVKVTNMKSPPIVTFESAQAAIHQCLLEYPKLYDYIVSTIHSSDEEFDRIEMPVCFVNAINECRQLLTSESVSPKEFERIQISLLRLLNLIDVDRLLEHFKVNLDIARKSLNDEVNVLTSLSLDTQVADNLLIAHAHRKIRNLQAHLQAERTLNEGNIEREVRKRYEQRLSDIEKQIRSKVENEQAVKLRQLIDDELANHERVLQVHHEQQLHQQKIELQKEMDEKLESSILEVLVQTHNEIAEQEAKLDMLKHLFSTQIIAEQKSRQAQQIWIEASRLKENALLNADRLSVLSIIKKMRGLSGRCQLTDKLLNLLSEQMTYGPLTTSSELVDRFQYVRNVADHVIGVDNHNCTLGSFAKAYLMSIWRRLTGVQKVIHLNRDGLINLSGLTNEYILAVANGFILNEDITSAVRILLLLSGEPRQAVASWINDAINFLTVKQNCDLILSLSTSACLYSTPQLSQPL